MPKASTLSGAEVFVSCCGRRVTSGRASASFVANPPLLTGGFLTPVGGKSTPAYSGCQGNITTYCIPCRDGPNEPYDPSTSTGNSHACNTVRRWAGGAEFWLIVPTWLGAFLMGPVLLLHQALENPWGRKRLRKIVWARCGGLRRTTPSSSRLFYLCVRVLTRL